MRSVGPAGTGLGGRHLAGGIAGLVAGWGIAVGGIGLAAGRGRCIVAVGRAGIRLAREGRTVVDIAVVVVARHSIQWRRLLVAAEGIQAAGIAEVEGSPGLGRGNCTAAWGSRSCIVDCIGCCRGRTYCVMFGVYTVDFGSWLLRS